MSRNAQLLKECQITCDSHLKHAIELVKLVGLPDKFKGEALDSQASKVNYIVNVLTPYLATQTNKNANALYDYKADMKDE